MKDLSRDGYASQEVMGALHGATGSRQVKFRYDIIRNGAAAGTLPVSSASVQYRKDNSIKRTARFAAGEGDINWLTDQIQPVMLVKMPDKWQIIRMATTTWNDMADRYATWDGMSSESAAWDDLAGFIESREKIPGKWLDWPLGVFLPTTVTKSTDGAAVSYNVEAYDRSVILSEDSTTDRLTFSAGTKYSDAILSVLVSAGFEQALIAETAATMQVDRSWEIGTAKLEIVNQLLQEINYDTFSVNEVGLPVMLPYAQPSPDGVTMRYEADDLSVIRPESDTALDAFKVPNVFVGYVSNPDYTGSSSDEDLRYVYENNNATSPTSTISRDRRIVMVIQPNNIASAEDLRGYVTRIAYQQSQIYETVSFETALMPIHGNGEVLAIQHPQINGVYEEIGWEMDLSAGGAMRHEARKVVIV